MRNTSMLATCDLLLPIPCNPFPKCEQRPVCAVSMPMGIKHKRFVLVKKMKDTTIFTILGLILFSLVISSCNSITGNVVYSLPVQKPDDFDDYPYGGFGLGASVDTDYTEFTVDVYPWAPEGPSQSSLSDAPVRKLYSLGFYFKYPFNVGPVVLYPMAGADMTIGGLSIGGGVDVPLSEKLFIRGGAMYGFGMPGGIFGAPQLGQSGTLTARVALGYKFGQGTQGISSSSSSAGSSSSSQGNDRNRLFGALIPLTSDSDLNASRQIRTGVTYPIMWSQDLGLVFIPDYSLADVDGKSQAEGVRMIANGNYLVLSPLMKNDRYYNNNTTMIMYTIIGEIKGSEIANSFVLVGTAEFQRTRENNIEVYVGIFDIDPKHQIAFRRFANRIENVD